MDIRFVWVPGHNNMSGHKIAKKATKELALLWNIITYSYTKHLINLNLYQFILIERIESN